MKLQAFDAVYDATMTLLPPNMASPEARAMLVAIGLQESRFEHRRQIGGPAMGFWQFERSGGVVGVLNHRQSRMHIRNVLDSLCYGYTPETSYAAIEHNDLLACTYARLLLWTDPGTLPKRGQHQYGWDYYLRNWRPGAPHPSTWPEFFNQAWADV